MTDDHYLFSCQSTVDISGEVTRGGVKRYEDEQVVDTGRWLSLADVSHGPMPYSIVCI